MKRTLLILLAVGGLASVQHYLFAATDAQGGNVAVAPDSPSGTTLNSKVTPPPLVQAALRANIGGAVATGTAASYAAVPPVAGSIVFSGTAVKIFLSATNYLFLASGTTTVASGTNY